MGKITVIGVGPGSKDYITPIAEKKIQESEVLIGGKQQLALFPDQKTKMEIGKNLDIVVEFIKKNRDKKIAVLTSGDPGFYSILGLILNNFSKKDIEIIPGISSVQLCFAKAKEMWHDAWFMSLHGRETTGLIKQAKKHRKLAILTDQHMPPNIIATWLIENGIKSRRVVVCEDLSRPDEKVLESNLEEVSKMTFSRNCVMVIIDEMGI